MRIKTAALILVLLAYAAAGSFAQNRIAVLDFQVESPRQDFQHLGKGFAEFISVELSGVERIVLVDRKQRNAVLDELRFGISGAADEQTAKELGRLLSADYLITGMIIDLAGTLVVTCELIAVETGEVLVHEKADGSLAHYDRITRRLAGAVVAELELTDGAAERLTRREEPADKKAPSEEDAATVLSSFSEAVDAYDAGDTVEARRKLEQAAELDQDNRAVRFYLDKLYVSTSKFKVVPAAYFTQSNPASLSFLENDALGVNINTGGTWPFHKPWPNGTGEEPGMYELDGLYGTSGTDRYAVDESDNRLFAYYKFPLGRNMGASIEVFGSNMRYVTRQYGQQGETMVLHDLYGGILSLGWAPASWLSLGLSLTGGYNDLLIFYQNGGGTVHEYPSVPPLLAASGGFVLKNEPGSLIFSAYLGTSTFESYLIDMVNEDKGEKRRLPLYSDFSFVAGFNRMRTYFILKFIEDWFIVPDTGPYTHIIPAVEHWFTPALSVRLGPVINTQYSLDSTYFGATLGTTIKWSDEWETNLSATYRYRVSRVTEEERVPELVLGIGLERAGLWLRRGAGD
jgi:TolB-like protein